MSALSRIAHEWAVRCFGDKHVINSGTRSLRTVEEAIELCQALGVSRELAHKAVDTVYSRPIGEPEQEIGGVLLTINILCESLGVDADALFERELRRVLMKSPEHFAKRNKDKVDLGLDASAQTPGDSTDDRVKKFIAVDRLWRNEAARLQFEKANGFTADQWETEPYQVAFRAWAGLSEVVRAEQIKATLHSIPTPDAK